jgi:hypothetical protein
MPDPEFPPSGSPRESLSSHPGPRTPDPATPDPRPLTPDPVSPDHRPPATGHASADEPPPFGGSWSALYAAVVGVLAALIVLFAFFTRAFE